MPLGNRRQVRRSGHGRDDDGRLGADGWQGGWRGGCIQTSLSEPWRPVLREQDAASPRASSPRHRHSGSRPCRSRGALGGWRRQISAASRRTPAAVCIMMVRRRTIGGAIVVPHLPRGGRSSPPHPHSTSPPRPRADPARKHLQGVACRNGFEPAAIARRLTVRVAVPRPRTSSPHRHIERPHLVPFHLPPIAPAGRLRRVFTPCTVLATDGAAHAASRGCDPMSTACMA